MAFIYNLFSHVFSQKCSTVEVKNIKGWLLSKSLTSIYFTLLNNMEQKLLRIISKRIRQKERCF